MSWIAGNRYLSQTEMENNADMFWGYFSPIGWSINAVSGMLGNIQSESTVNPGVWENLDEGNLNGGYGLVQWTPASKYIDWAGVDYDDGNKQCGRIVWEVDNNAQWIATDKYPLTFKEFTTSTETPYYLAMAFLANYERPLEPDQPQRGTQAESWYTYLSGKPPPTPITYSKLPLWMMLRPF